MEFVVFGLKIIWPNTWNLICWCVQRSKSNGRQRFDVCLGLIHPQSHWWWWWIWKSALSNHPGVIGPQMVQRVFQCRILWSWDTNYSLFALILFIWSDEINPWDPRHSFLQALIDWTTSKFSNYEEAWCLHLPWKIKWSIIIVEWDMKGSDLSLEIIAVSIRFGFGRSWCLHLGNLLRKCVEGLVYLFWDDKSAVPVNVGCKYNLNHLWVTNFCFPHVSLVLIVSDDILYLLYHLWNTPPVVHSWWYSLSLMFFQVQNLGSGLEVYHNWWMYLNYLIITSMSKFPRCILARLFLTTFVRTICIYSSLLCAWYFSSAQKLSLLHKIKKLLHCLIISHVIDWLGAESNKIQCWFGEASIMLFWTVCVFE